MHVSAVINLLSRTKYFRLANYYLRLNTLAPQAAFLIDNGPKPNIRQTNIHQTRRYKLASRSAAGRRSDRNRHCVHHRDVGVLRIKGMGTVSTAQIAELSAGYDEGRVC